jgi:hypothetical protein
MNRFVKTALSIAVAGSAANAGTGDNDWAALDSEISRLATPLSPSQDGAGWAVLVRAAYSFSSDDLFTGGMGEPDISGFSFNDVDLAFWGNYGPFGLRFSADFDGNDDDDFTGSEDLELGLEDAYVRWGCGEYLSATVGNYKPRLSLSNSVDPEHQLFIDRSVIGSSGDWWDNGIGLSGNLEMFSWYAGLQNGSNNHASDHFYFLRGEFNFGSGVGMYEGAMGSSDAFNGTVGLTFMLNDTFDFTGLGPTSSGGDLDGDDDSDNTAWVLDFGGNVSNIGFGAEVAMLDDDFRATTDEDYSNLWDGSTRGFLDLAEDSIPWSVYGSYLINPEWEVAVRYEDLDNGELIGSGVGPTLDDGPDNTILSFAVNWYRANAGKWQAQYTMVEADGDFDDGNIIEIGYAVGTTR